ncbi:MAG: methyl-accepting chemotaxis protein, partial [Pacificimonas sp.]
MVSKSVFPLKSDASDDASPATVMTREDERLIRDVARDCGALAVDCSASAGFIVDVADRISTHLETLGTLEEVTSSLIRDQHAVADATTEARDLSETMLARLDGGRDVIDNAISSVDELTKMIVDLGGRMSNFAAAMAQVESVAGSIETIASKTNMLALNATIEAARAGDAGRGFAVVAAEVKTLAEETRSATAEIKRTVGSLGGEADELQAEIEEGTRRSEQSQSHFAGLRATVADVSTLVRQADGQSEEIARSTQTISASAQQVRDGLSAYASDARKNGEDLGGVRDRLGTLE